MNSGKPLSPQQKIILQHLVDGCTVKEISLFMGITIATVRKHINKAKVKLNAKTQNHTIALVVASGEVTVQMECGIGQSGN